ncbi:MAG TPA: hypothetical protein PK304_00210 [Mobilitalea sp.]|nr:hypothetical protein [Mobilitalea sp.]
MNTNECSKNKTLWAKDDIDSRNRILNVLKSVNYRRSIKLPQNIWFDETDKGVKMSLSNAAIGLGNDNNLNMQENAAAFEGWAVSIYTHYLAPLNSKDLRKRKIILGLQEKTDIMQNVTGKNGHFNRFLYRAMRFSEEYGEWIELEPDLEEAVNLFRKNFRKEEFINNKPDLSKRKLKSKLTDNPTKEDEVENTFVEREDLRRKLLDRANMKTDKLYRQLPVGLFKGEVNKNNSIFTGGKSAIDLWAIDDEYIALFELKTNNIMIGIITELFFYSEFVYDIFINRENINKADLKDKETGYYELAPDETKNKKIKAYFLTNGIHPLITKEVIGVLNSGKKGKEGLIRYDIIDYDLSVNMN